MKDTLSERLAAVADRSTLRLTHHGRKSGKAYMVTIWFVVDGERVYLATMNRKRQWVRNVLKKPHVRLDIGGAHFDGVVEPISGHRNMAAAYDRFVQKYWAMWLRDWIATLTFRNPRSAEKFAPGRSGFFRVELTAR